MHHIIQQRSGQSMQRFMLLGLRRSLDINGSIFLGNNDLGGQLLLQLTFGPLDRDQVSIVYLDLDPFGDGNWSSSNA
jgi:hypothetical protein